jgi:site-specific DNA recombinase
VQQLLNENNVRRGMKFSESGALLQGKLFDDKGNRMGPTFSSKQGVRYRFYISTALRGRKHKAGSVTRISAPEIESLVATKVRDKLNADELTNEELFGLIDQVTVSTDKIQITLRDAGKKIRPIEIPWKPKPKVQVQIQFAPSEAKTDPKLIKAIVRAHAWLGQLSSGHHKSIEDLAAAAGYNPKVIRQGLRLEFLAPKIVEAAILRDAHIRLKQIPKLLPLPWSEQHQSID